MRIFINELKKLLNLKILLVILVLGGLTYAAFSNELISGYEELKYNGIFNEFQLDMFEKYGAELSPEEYADYRVADKIVATAALIDAIIANEPTFAKYGITGFDNYNDGMNAFWQAAFPEGGGEMLEPYITDHEVMYNAFKNYASASGDEILKAGGDFEALVDNKPIPIHGGKLTLLHSLLDVDSALRAVEMYYTPGNTFLESLATHDMRPVVDKAATEYMKRESFSLINYDLTVTFSMYAAVTAVFAVVAALLLAAPFITTDRSRKMQYLQYSSMTGRKLFSAQLLAAAVAALLVGVVTIAASYGAFFLNTDAANYLDCSAQFYSFRFFLFDITFGQYAAVLAGLTLVLCVAAACFAVVLGRFSSNILSMMLKAVPVGAALSVISALALFNAFSTENILMTGGIAGITGSIPYIEALVCGGVAVLGIVAAAAVVRRERWVDAA